MVPIWSFSGCNATRFALQSDHGMVRCCTAQPLGATMAVHESSAMVQLKFRVREGLRAKLEEAARQRGVSLNAEIVHRLEQSFRVGQIEQERDAALNRMHELIDVVVRLSRSLPSAETRPEKTGIHMGPGSSRDMPGWPPEERDK
jgi:Arc-like DNA binding dprotein